MEALISKRNERHEISETLIKKCSVFLCHTYLFAYNEVNNQSIFIMFQKLIGRVFIFLHIQFLFVSDKRHLSSGSSPGTF